MRERTQSNSPLVTFALQWVHVPAMLMPASEAPQLGQAPSERGVADLPAPRMDVQYSDYSRGFWRSPATMSPFALVV